MYQFCVLLSDFPDSGHNEKGYNLVNFLKVYFKESGINIIDNVNTIESISTDILFIILPNTVTKDTLSKIKFKKVILADYHDDINPRWENSDKKFLLSLTNCYSKISIPNNSQDDLKFGALPIGLRRIKSYLPLLQKNLSSRKYDIFFRGVATSYSQKSGVLYHQRIEWINEIINSNYISSLGIVEKAGYSLADICRQFPDMNLGEMQSKLVTKEIDFSLFFFQLQKAKISLCATGHARWSYRHYESILAKNIILSTEVNSVQLLIPFSEFNFVIVRDYEPISPIIDKILVNVKAYQEIVNENHSIINRYLKNGYYSREKKLLLDKFMSYI